MQCRLTEGGVLSRRAERGDGSAASSAREIRTMVASGSVWAARAVAVALVFGLMAVTAGPPREAAAGDLATVGTDMLNIRAEPSLDAPVVAQAAWGEILDVWWGPSEDGFYEVMYGGIHGYAAGAYIVFDGGAGGTVAGDTAVGGVSASNRWIDVDRSSGLVTLYENNVAIYTVWGAMGWEQSEDGFYATANGTYYVHAKEAGLTWTPWGRAYVTHYVEFDANRRNGFHSYSLDQNGHLLADGGNGPTGGCIAIAPWAIQQVYDFAVSGTRVEIHW
ncbi:MAG TPA: L,D-transpeptidase family protein [Thermomicrobiales bacterium]|nr:L,D-transpeptidase family protein [Thermomicrobiales bacterium]